MKKCSRCLELKEFSEFSPNKRAKDKYNYTCKVCGRISKRKYTEKHKDRIKANREKYKDKIKAYSKKYRAEKLNKNIKAKKKLEYALLLGTKCIFCDFVLTEKTVAAFDFHHKDPSKKEYVLSDMLMMKREKVLVELYKCVLLCSNCHRILHFEENRTLDNTEPSLIDKEGVETREQSRKLQAMVTETGNPFIGEDIVRST